MVYALNSEIHNTILKLVKPKTEFTIEVVGIRRRICLQTLEGHKINGTTSHNEIVLLGDYSDGWYDLILAFCLSDFLSTIHCLTSTQIKHELMDLI
uniref:Uncharacterized protein n=1 Tax=Romanomermis culicivorax TaxID=13658 RepID=A0A915K505_ROMCU